MLFRSSKTDGRIVFSFYFRIPNAFSLCSPLWRWLRSLDAHWIVIVNTHLNAVEILVFKLSSFFSLHFVPSFVVILDIITWHIKLTPNGSVCFLRKDEGYHIRHYRHWQQLAIWWGKCVRQNNKRQNRTCKFFTRTAKTARKITEKETGCRLVDGSRCRKTCCMHSNYQQNLMRTKLMRERSVKHVL